MSSIDFDFFFLQLSEQLPARREICAVQTEKDIWHEL